MAVRDGGARSVMNSYTEIDGVPVASSRELLTDLLRRRWGFDGTVVSDYFAVEFLRSMHGIADSLGEAAQLALDAGIDVELPGPDAYPHLAERVASGDLPEAVVDRAVARVLAEKEDLGLLDADFSTPPQSVDLDDAEHRALAYRLALESAVLLRNDGVLPLREPGRIAVIGPNADSADALMGCYSFANHVLAHHPGTPLGFSLPTVRDALTDRFGEVTYAPGCAVEGSDTAVSRKPQRPPATPRSRSSSSATARACSDAEPSARATMPTRSSSPVCSGSSSRRSSPPARPSCSCC